MKKRFNFVSTSKASSPESDRVNSPASTTSAPPPFQTEHPQIQRSKKVVNSLLIDARQKIIHALTTRFGIATNEILISLGEKLTDPSLSGIQVSSALLKTFRKTRRVLDIDLHKVIRDLGLIKNILQTLKNEYTGTTSLAADVAEGWHDDLSTLLNRIADIGSDPFIKKLIIDFVKNSTGTEELEQASFSQFYFGICLLEQSLMPIPGNSRGFLHLISEQFRTDAEKRRTHILSIVSNTRSAALKLVTP